TTNFGFIFQNYTNSKNKVTFDSSEAKTAANRPKLTIQFTQPAPVLLVNAGSDEGVSLPNALTLHATANYNNAAPLPGTASILWTMSSGPVTVSFDDPTSLTPTVTFTIAGDYILRLTIDDGSQIAFDEIAITVA